MKGHTLKEALEYTPAPREKNKYTKLTSDERLQRLRQVNIEIRTFTNNNSTELGGFKVTFKGSQ